MSTRGTHLTFAFAVVIALLLPKHVECGYPGASCNRAGKWRTICSDFEMEPLGIYLVELALRRDVGFAYSTGEDCR